MNVRASAGTLPSSDLSFDKLLPKNRDTFKIQTQMYFPLFSPPVTYYSSYLSVKYMEDLICKF